MKHMADPYDHRVRAAAITTLVVLLVVFAVAVWIALRPPR